MLVFGIHRRKQLVAQHVEEISISSALLMNNWITSLLAWSRQNHNENLFEGIFCALKSILADKSPWLRKKLRRSIPFPSSFLPLIFFHYVLQKPSRRYCVLKLFWQYHPSSLKAIIVIKTMKWVSSCCSCHSLLKDICLQLMGWLRTLSKQ